MVSCLYWHDSKRRPRPVTTRPCVSPARWCSVRSSKSMAPLIPSAYGLSPGVTRAVIACFMARQKVGYIPDGLKGLEQASGASDITQEDVDEAILAGVLQRGRGKLSLVVELESDPLPTQEAARDSYSAQAFHEVGSSEVVSDDPDDYVPFNLFSFFEDEEVMGLPERAQHILLRMLMACDHRGRGPADAEVILDHLKLRTPVDWELQVLAETGFVLLYEVGGHRFYEIVAFDLCGDECEPSLYPEPVR